jgi:hypothetical protein
MGGTSMSAFNTSKRKLTYAEEHILVDFIFESADQGIPMSLKNIEVHANSILASHAGDSEADTVGGSWVGRVLDWYRGELQTHWTKPLATERAKTLNKDAVDHWYMLVK